MRMASATCLSTTRAISALDASLVTALPADPNNPRSGRWGGTKLECGIHTFSERAGK